MSSCTRHVKLPNWQQMCAKSVHDFALLGGGDEISKKLAVNFAFLSPIKAEERGE